MSPYLGSPSYCSWASIAVGTYERDLSPGPSFVRTGCNHCGRYAMHRPSPQSRTGFSRALLSPSLECVALGYGFMVLQHGPKLPTRTFWEVQAKVSCHLYPPHASHSELQSVLQMAAICAGLEVSVRGQAVNQDQAWGPFQEVQDMPKPECCLFDRF